MPKAAANPRSSSPKGDSATKKSKATITDADIVGEVMPATTNAVRPSRDLTAPAGYVFLRHCDIKPDPDNARKHFDKSALQDLADSLFEKGLLQTPSVRPRSEDGLHQLTMGERRWRAWGLNIAAGRWDADRYELCRIGEAEDLEAMEAGLVENLQRSDLTEIEAARGFDLLATRFGRSNKDIAKATSRTPEFIQQRRRLLKLDTQDQARIERGDLTLHDALKKLGSPKYKALEPFEALVLVELAHALWRQGKWAYSYTGLRVARTISRQEGATVSRDAVDKLAKRGLIHAPNQHYATFEWEIRLGWEFTKDCKVLFPIFADPLPAPDADWPELDALLVRLRADAFGPEFQLQPGDVYSSPWLNPPFDISPEEQAELDRRAERDRKEKAKSKKAQEKAKAAVAKLKAVADGFKATPLPPLPGLQDTLEALGVTLPLSRSGDKLMDAAGRQILSTAYEYSYDKPSIDKAAAIQLIAAAVNAATGYAKTKVDAPEEKGPDRAAFVAAMAKTLGEIYTDQTAAENAAQAERHLEGFLTEHDLKFGHPSLRWDADAAYELAHKCDADAIAQAVEDRLAEDDNPDGDGEFDEEDALSSEASAEEEPLPDSLKALAGIPAEDAQAAAAEA